jgi:hypothetical protein
MKKEKKVFDSPKKNSIKQIINMNRNNMKKNIKDNINKIKEITKIKNNIQSKTERENLVLNDLNIDSKYSIELEDEEEEEEFDSDEYISSTMLDVETNTYVEKIDKKSNASSNVNISHNILKSLTKENENQIGKNYVKTININNNEIIQKNEEIEKVNLNQKNNKKDKHENSASPKLNNKNNNNDKTDEILYQKLNLKKVQNNENKANDENRNNDENEKT